MSDFNAHNDVHREAMHDWLDRREPTPPPSPQELEPPTVAELDGYDHYTRENTRGDAERDGWDYDGMDEAAAA